MIDRKGRLYAVGDGEGSMSSPEMEIDYYYSKRGTAGSHYAARLLRRAAAGSFGWLSSPRPLPQPIKKLKRREWLRQSSTESATDTQVAFSGCKVFTCSELMVVSIMLIEKRKHSAKNFRRGTSQSTIKLTLLLLQNRLIHTQGRAYKVYVNARSN